MSSTPTAAPARAPVLLPPARPSRFRRPVLTAFSGMQRGCLRLDLPDATATVLGRPGDPTAVRPLAGCADAGMHIHRDAFFEKCFWSGDIGFAESYVDGDWDSPDLTAVLGFFILNVENAPTLSGSKRAQSAALNLFRFGNRLRHLLRPNNRAIARRNIREHYDLSNEFFGLWLDPSMMYSAAKWPAHAPHLPLEAAQREKNDALCRKLRLRPTDRVLEIGSGWGGWAIHAAREYGCHVTTITISQQQFDLAQARVRAAGLTERVEVRLCDFRDVTGAYDKIVSIEMVEALGHAYQAAFAAVVARLLKPEGLLALQFITCPDARYEQFRRGVDFVQKHIFPGSLLLSVNRLNGLLADAGGLVLHELDDFGPDYARTLRLWREAFRARLAEVRALGFDERFIRKWTYYLCYCEAAFALRNISVVHTVHTRPNNHSL
jgi:cyclopropane-fatty-acyl-phospholipid synthase